MIRTAFHRFEPDQRAMIVQLIRFGITGGVITLVFSAAYWAVATWFHLDPMLSLTIVFIVFSAISYVAHGAFSFKDHGDRDADGAPGHHVRLGRFFAVNLLGFALNQLFVWGLVKQLHGPTWWPIIPFVFVTPLVTFALHRRYVYA